MKMNAWCFIVYFSKLLQQGILEHKIYRTLRKAQAQYVRFQAFNVFFGHFRDLTSFRK